MNYRQDLQLKSDLESKGWKVVRHVMDSDKPEDSIPNFPLQFHKDGVVVWNTGKKWIKAKLDLTGYSEHQSFDCLIDATKENS